MQLGERLLSLGSSFVFILLSLKCVQTHKHVQQSLELLVIPNVLKLLTAPNLVVVLELSLMVPC